MVHQSRDNQIMELIAQASNEVNDSCGLAALRLLLQTMGDSPGPVVDGVQLRRVTKLLATS